MINKEILQKFITWTNFVAIITIILGVLSALGGVMFFLIGAAPGVLMIIAGIKLLNAKKSASDLMTIDDPNLFTEQLNQMLTEATGFFKFQGILYIVSIVVGIIGFVASIVLIATGFGSMY